MKDIVERLRLSTSGLKLCSEAANEIENLRALIFNMTHHEGALEEFKPKWMPIVQEELGRRL